MSVNKVQTKMVRLGDYIEVYDLKNINTLDLPFFGINKDKAFMPTVANTTGLDKSKYKIVEKEVFVFSGMQTGRDVCIRLALYEKDDSILISPAYTTFIVKDKSVLLPQYLFIQFNRFQMDRYGWFLSDGSVRSNLDWNIFCDIQIPLPDINTQQELVNTYNGLKALAEQNENLIQPLTQACQAYIINCKKKYPEVVLGKYIEQTENRNSELLYGVNDVVGMTITKQIIPTKADVRNTDLSKFLIVTPREFVYNPRTHGKKIGLGFNNEEKTVMISWNNISFKVQDAKLDVSIMPEYLYLLFCREEWDREACFRSLGSSTEVFSWTEMCGMKIPLPPPEEQQAIVNLYNCAEEAKKIATEAREKMKTLCPALVQKAING
ncbi:restriction endonuclease subunit S [Maribacter sp. TH_r10]|uniref:restriction endonuclease subunit S n=1 Tax=Maribacter sp. TH_r10 TaxID=3082086 RepID=UPI002953AFDD|nr:restriction endonuclease subunit S [Maribacter sp. TH_r10]MDV7138226.1 restriction endonuclease subunit S [Maribacter sp. TH_r10]